MCWLGEKNVKQRRGDKVVVGMRRLFVPRKADVCDRTARALPMAEETAAACYRTGGATVCPLLVGCAQNCGVYDYLALLIRTWCNMPCAISTC